MRISLHFLSYILGAVALLLAGQFLMAQEGPRGAGTQMDKESTVFSKFKTHLVDRLPMGYKVGVADIDGDGKLDIIALATEPSCLVWYKNPSWEGPRGAVPQKYVLTSKTKEYVDLAPYDIDGDGQIDLAVAHKFGMSLASTGRAPIMGRNAKAPLVKRHS